MASAVDRVPQLGELLSAEQWDRCLEPLRCMLAADAIAVYDNSGHRQVLAADVPDVLPAELPTLCEGEPGTSERLHNTLDVSGRHCDVRRVALIGEGLGVVVIAWPQGETRGPQDASRIRSVVAVIEELLQAHYAAWVTSQLHQEAHSARWTALSEQNRELQRAVEHLRHIDTLKSNFLATVSHELRTPLTSVIGYADMLLTGVTGPLEGEQREYVEVILARGKELFELISNLLETAQIEKGRVTSDFTSVCLAAVAEDAMAVLRLAAAERRVTMESRLEHLPAVYADPNNLRRILINLLSNAIKFSPRGTMVVIAGQVAPMGRPFSGEDRFGDDADSGVRVMVRDQGEGIPEDQLEHIFEPFYQVDAGPTRRRGGAGLGLAIVRGLVRAHGGEIWAESSPAGGTAVYFTIAPAPSPASDSLPPQDAELGPRVGDGG